MMKLQSLFQEFANCYLTGYHSGLWTGLLMGFGIGVILAILAYNIFGRKNDNVQPIQLQNRRS